MAISPASERAVRPQQLTLEARSRRKPLPDHLPREDVVLDYRRAISAAVAAVRCMRSARASARCWTGCRRSSRDAHHAPEICLPQPATRWCRRRRRNGRSPADWQRRRCSPRCWSANIATTRRSIGNRRSSPVTASISDARRWPDWVGGACWWLEALHERLCKHVFASDHLFADDTPIPVLDPGRGRTKTGRLWVYARDQRPWGGPTTGGGLSVCAGPQGRTSGGASRALQRRAACRWLCRASSG